ncbi:MAG: multiheme c-type cytochrome [Planctomycetaceae bacterium]
MSIRVVVPATIVLALVAASAYLLNRNLASAEKPAKVQTQPPAFGPLLAGWTRPEAVLVLSGEQHGYIEPCGCSLNQLGGLSRRADLVRQIRERGWPVLPLDVGGLVNNPTRRQAKLKLAMALKCLRDMGYAGIALGREELLIGIELLTYGEPDRPPFLASNLVLFGSPPDSGLHQSFRVVAVGKVKIGVTAVFGNSLKVPGFEQNPQDLEILDPVASLTKALAALEAEKPDLRVLLSHARLDETKELAAKFPQFDLIVSAGGSEDGETRLRTLERALLVTPGQKGKHVGVVGFYPDRADQRLRFEQVALDETRFKDTPAIQQHMREYQETLQVHDLVARDAAIDSPWNAQLTQPNQYVGARVCGECHTRAYKKWLETPHAHATEAIKFGRKAANGKYSDAFIGRIFDPECVNCHVTGWSPDAKVVSRYNSGFESERATPHLTGQQCENCHGPGGRHTELERRFKNEPNLAQEVEKLRDLAHIPLDQAAVKACVKCHDGDNDPHFKTDGDVFEEYWDKIKHPWRD